MSEVHRGGRVAYVVLPFGGYADTAADYVDCMTRADVEAQLVDYGWMNNPAVHVFIRLRSESFAGRVRELVESKDPYPDYVVERGPRGGVQWNRA